MEFKIPKTFMIGGQTVKVKFNNELLHKDDCRGMAAYRDNTLSLQTDGKQYPILPSQTAQTYLHEKVHFILSTMGEHELRCNEKFVDLFAELLLQTIRTEKGVLKTLVIDD